MTPYDEHLIDEAVEIWGIAHDANLSIMTAVNMIAGRLRAFSASPSVSPGPPLAPIPGRMKNPREVPNSLAGEEFRKEIA
jgi:hypothetical protein